MLAWSIKWLDPLVVDIAKVISMALRVSPGYARLWTTMHPSLLGLDEIDSKNDDEESTPSEEEDLMNVDNPIHDGPTP